MPLLVNSVPNLAQGVSQQPDNLRYPGQCDEQINAWATVVEGLKKRPNTNYVKNLDTTSTSSNIFTHFVKRDETNQYILSVSLGGVSAYDVSLGTSIPVTVTSIANSYLSLGTSVTDPLNDLRALTVADYTFLVNKKREVKVDTNTVLLSKHVQDDEGKYNALVFVKLGDYEKTYDIYIDGDVIPHGGTSTQSNKTPPSGHTYESGSANSSGTHADTEIIAQDLETILNAYFGSEGIVGGASLTGGSGFAPSGKTSVRSGLGQGSKTYTKATSYEYFIEQFEDDATVPGIQPDLDQKIGIGAKGTLIIGANGAVQSSVLTQKGRGYDNTQTVPGTFDKPFVLTIKKIEADATVSGAKTNPNRNYRVETEETLYTSFPSTPGVTMPDFLTGLSIPGGSNYEVERDGSVVKITGDEDFSIRTEDGLGNQGLGLVYKEVGSITDLPTKCYNNFRVRVRGDADIAQDDYYVRFQTKDREEFGEGSWVETVGWDDGSESAKGARGIDTTIDFTTMPIVLVVDSYDASTGKINSFTLQTPNEYSNVVVNNGTYYNLVEDHISTSDTEPGTGDGVESSGVFYRCIQDHTSAAANEPGTGVDWVEYWTADPSISSASAWSSGVSYDGTSWLDYWVTTTAVNSAQPWKTNAQYFERPPGYGRRRAGDGYTNPFPSFVDQTINDVFFFKNRLGFVTDTSVIFSEADNYFNFFRTTTQQLLDSAPIDVGLSHTKVAILQHAIPFQEKLMLFSKQSQFVLRGADILSPKTVAISPVTEYDISDSVEPVALGNYIYFTFKRNDFEGLYEYFVDNNTELFDAEEVTQQVPKYIPNNVRKIAGSQQENTICIGVDSDLKTLYVYKYFWSNKEKIQSAWMKFTFDRDVVGFDFIDSKLYMITKDTEGLHLEFLTLEDGLTDEGLGYPLLLDSRVDGNDVTVSLYNASTKKTRISGIPYNVSLGTDIEIYTKIGTQRAITMVDNTTVDVTGALASYVSNGGTVYKCVHTDPNTQVHTSTAATEPGTGADWTDYWVVSTDFSSATAWALGKTYNDDTYFVIGKPYNMLYRFSNQAIKQPTERGGRSASDYTFQTIRNGSINYADTGHFVVEVTPEYRDTYKYVFNPDITGANLLLNEFEPQDGHFRFAVQGQPDKVTIEVKSDSALPCKLLAAEFESMVIPRSKRYGS